MKLSDNYAHECAKQFTVVALENKLIHAPADPKVTAKNVTDFYKTIVKELTEIKIAE